MGASVGSSDGAPGGALGAASGGVGSGSAPRGAAGGTLEDHSVGVPGCFSGVSSSGFSGRSPVGVPGGALGGASSDISSDATVGTGREIVRVNEANREAMIPSGLSFTDDMDYDENIKAVHDSTDAAVASVSSMLESRSGHVVTDVGEMKRNTQGVSNKRDGVVSKVDPVNITVQGLPKEVEDLPATQTRQYLEGRYGGEKGEKIWPLLPLLVNGRIGRAGWVPVDINLGQRGEAELIVLSLPMTAWLMSKQDDGLVRKDVSDFLKGNLLYCSSGHDMLGAKFLDILALTRFKSYALQKNNGLHMSKGNAENYLVIGRAAFSKILSEIKYVFPERPMFLSSVSETAKLPVNTMHQNYSVVSQSPTDNRSAYIPLLDKHLSYEERKTCLPMLTPWWKECYTSAYISFFEMDSSATSVGHFINGQ